MPHLVETHRDWSCTYVQLGPTGCTICADLCMTLREVLLLHDHSHDLSCHWLQQVAKTNRWMRSKFCISPNIHDQLYVLQIDKNRTTKKSYDPVWLKPKQQTSFVLNPIMFMRSHITQNLMHLQACRCRCMTFSRLARTHLNQLINNHRIHINGDIQIGCSCMVLMQAPTRL